MTKEPTQEQQMIIDYSRNTVVTAKPGSGKTYTVVEKIFKVLTSLLEYHLTGHHWKDRFLHYEKPPNKSAEKICNQYSQRKDAIKKEFLQSNPFSVQLISSISRK